ncbi:hypothetical protein NUW58_g10273 [Xylaria curta]|uniref:Uncharacterized protein n=1 Tax=Xylaria curta TaxID=42375 RepID=A0ACC1MND8_9PEZI|nr:hypothetical protein NUW58_g10273 [Xylaria curta]
MFLFSELQGNIDNKQGDLYQIVLNECAKLQTLRGRLAEQRRWELGLGEEGRSELQEALVKQNFWGGGLEANVAEPPAAAAAGAGSAAAAAAGAGSAAAAAAAAAGNHGCRSGRTGVWKYPQHLS